MIACHQNSEPGSCAELFFVLMSCLRVLVSYGYLCTVFADIFWPQTYAEFCRFLVVFCDLNELVFLRRFNSQLPFHSRHVAFANLSTARPEIQ